MGVQYINNKSNAFCFTVCECVWEFIRQKPRLYQGEIEMKKLVAAVAAVVMAFAMAVPAFASESPATDNYSDFYDIEVIGTGAEFTVMDDNSAEAEKLDEILGSFSDEIKAMGLSNVTMWKDGLYEISGDASSVSFKLVEYKLDLGAVPFALQLKADGTWSIVELTRKDDNSFYGAFDKDAQAFAFITGFEENYVDTKVESADPDKIIVTVLDNNNGAYIGEYSAVKESFENNKANIDAELAKKGYDAGSLEIVGFFDVSRKDGSEEGARVTLLVDKSAPAGKRYVILHQIEYGKWEVLEVTASKDGKQLTVDFPSFSKVVLALVSDPLYQTADGKGTSPKTGDNGAVAVIVDALA